LPASRLFRDIAWPLRSKETLGAGVPSASGADAVWTAAGV
jgi:hypothetical protein